MKVLVYVLLAVESLLVRWVLKQPVMNSLSVLLLAGNSVLLIWSAARLLGIPSCCR